MLRDEINDSLHCNTNLYSLVSSSMSKNDFWSTYTQSTLTLGNKSQAMTHEGIDKSQEV